MKFPFVAVLFAGLACVGSAQSGKGVYQPKGGPAANWHISALDGLIWNNEPYRPVGLRLSGVPAEIDEAATSKILDVMVDVPASGSGWDTVVEVLEKRKMRYFLHIDSLAPAAEGFVVEPQTYRIGGITQKQLMTVRVPGCRSAIIVLAARRDSSIVSCVRVSAKEDILTFEVKPPNDLEHVALIYPETTAVGLPDLWEGFDDHRDHLLSSIRKHANGPGLRGIVNPLGQLVKRNQDLPFAPTSPRFRAEFSRYLEERYRNVNTAMRSWGMASADLESFDVLARLIPLWSGTRGVGLLFDPTDGKTYSCELRRSQFWPDLRLVVASEEAKRYQKLVTSIKKVANVPVLQEWRGWLGWYEAANTHLDGLTSRANAESYSQLIETACRPASSVLRWNKPGLMFASHLEYTSNPQDERLSNMVSELFSMGYRGAFLRTENPAVRALIVAEANSTRPNGSPNPEPLFFPENALNPANPQRLPMGKWWLPAPVRGNRVPMGEYFFAYRLEETGNTTSVIWSKEPVAKIKLRFALPKEVQLRNLDGTDPVVRRHKNSVEVNFSDQPILVSNTEEFPVPEPAVNEALTRFERMLKQADALRMDVTEEVLAFRDGSKALDQNPSPGFQTMMNALQRMNNKLAPFMWLEAENFRDSNFSEVQLASGCINGAALSLRVNLIGLTNDFRSSYTFMPRSGQELEVWVAARIPREYRSNLSVFISGQMLKISSEPVSLYSNEYGWYRLGTTRLSGAQSTVEVRVSPTLGLDIALDAIVLYPGQFRPNGVNQPDALTALGITGQ